jgi:DNA-binding NtrC family response regulator
MAILSGQTLDERFLPELEIGLMQEDDGGFLSLREHRHKIERTYIISALIKAEGNISGAANLIDVERTYLHKKILQYKISKKEYFIK